MVLRLKSSKLKADGSYSGVNNSVWNLSMHSNRSVEKPVDGPSGNFSLEKLRIFLSVLIIWFVTQSCRKSNTSLVSTD